MIETAQPRLAGATAAPTTAVVIVLPGGRANGRNPFRVTQLANVRMVPFAVGLRRSLRDRGVAVWQLRYRLRGWNAPDLDPVRDLRWALGYAARHHPGVAVILVGHSMGARTALRAGGDPGIVGICALAPWLEPGEPATQLAGRRVLVAHGDRDRITDPRESPLYVARCRAAGADAWFVTVRGDGHAMLRHAAVWSGLVHDFVHGIVDRLRLGHPV